MTAQVFLYNLRIKEYTERNKDVSELNLMGRRETFLRRSETDLETDLQRKPVNEAKREETLDYRSIVCKSIITIISNKFKLNIYRMFKRNTK